MFAACVPELHQAHAQVPSGVLQGSWGASDYSRRPLQVAAAVLHRLQGTSARTGRGGLSH